MEKTAEGAVVIDHESCFGGAKCRSVCPWNIPQRQRAWACTWTSCRASSAAASCTSATCAPVLGVAVAAVAATKAFKKGEA